MREHTHVLICRICERPFRAVGNDKYCSPACGGEATARRHLQSEIDGTTHRVKDVTASYIPTEEEIAAACEAMRAGWNEREHHVRAGLAAPEADVPVARAMVSVARRWRML